MKTRIVLTTAFASLLPCAAAFAQTPASPEATPLPASTPFAPAPPAPPAPPHPPRRSIPGNDRPHEPVTFLGVETSRVPRVVSEQLGLPRGFGVVVDYVVPASAAAATGLQQNDIIRMLNDQIVIDSEQLGVLVRSFPEGATINLTILRKGQEMKLTSRLQQKQARSGHDAVGYEWNFDGLEDFQMPDMATVREAMARAKKEVLRAGDQAREAARKLRVVTSDDGTVKTSHVDLGQAQIVFSDEKGELRLERVDGKKVLTAKDAAGKLLYQGAVDSEADLAKLPPEVRQRYESLRHQDLPPIPPHELAPRPPGPDQSARLDPAAAEQATLPLSAHPGWRRSTMLL